MAQSCHADDAGVNEERVAGAFRRQQLRVALERVEHDGKIEAFDQGVAVDGEPVRRLRIVSTAQRVPRRDLGRGDGRRLPAERHSRGEPIEQVAVLGPQSVTLTVRDETALERTGRFGT